MTGLILLAHGARDPNWAAPFEAVAALLRKRHPEVAVRLAYLEFMPPDALAAGSELAQLGCTDVSVLPLFLGAGGHVRKDLPPLLVELRRANPQVQWTLHAAAGEDAVVIRALADAASAALSNRALTRPAA